MVALLRAQAGRTPYDKPLTDLIGELSTRSEPFRTRWARHDVRLHLTGTKRIHHPVVGDLDLRFETMELPADPGLALLIYTAEPSSATEQALTILAGWADGNAFVQQTVDEITRNVPDALVLVTWDESGGYFDHVAPPTGTAATQVDGQPYGPRVPLLALGAGARGGTVSHVQLEHSSIARFIEWNWLGATGQLGGRDAVVHNLGSLLAPNLHVPS